jgi:hypothetical protein
MSREAESLQENHFAFETDQDTIFLFNCILYFLVNHFGHTRNESIEAINRFYKKLFEQNTDTDWLEWLHHDGWYLCSLQIEFEEFSPNKGLPAFSPAYFEWRNNTYREKDPTVTIESLNALLSQLEKPVTLKTIITLSIDEYEIIKSCLGHQHKFDYIFQPESLTYHNNKVELSIPSEQLIYFMYGLVDAKKDKETTSKNYADFGHKIDSIIDRLYTEFYR